MSLLKTLKYIAAHPLNKDNRVESLIAYFKWQLGSRLINSDIVFDWINNSKVIVANGDSGFTGNIYCGLHDFSDMSFLLHLLAKDDLFVDIGANIGSYTILACAAKKALGVAIEPCFESFKKLKNNLLINQLEGRVQYLNIAIGAERRVQYFTTSNGPTNHFLSEVEENKNCIATEIQPLDDILGDRCPVLMKIDVEGYEKFTLEGAKNCLMNEHLKAVIMELNGSGYRYGVDENSILELMYNLGFKTYSYEPFKRKLIDLSGKNLKEGNTLFIRDKFYVQKVINKAPYFIINGHKI